MKWLLKSGEVLVGGMLIYSGLHHIANPYQFAAATAAYDLVPLTWLQYLPFVLSALLICLGLCLVFARCIEMARILAFAVLTVFAAAQSISWLAGKQISCGCFGFSDEPISLRTIAMPAGCALVCFANLFFRWPRSGKRSADDYRLEQAGPLASSTGLTREAFTLVELLVVIAVIGVLIGMLIPAVQSVREAARRSACQNNIRQVGMGLLNYEAANRRFPEGIDIEGDRYASSWLVSILPHVEQTAVADQAAQDYAAIPFQFTWHEGFRTVVPAYQCPSDPLAGQQQVSHGNLIVTITNYLGVSGNDYIQRDGMLFDDSKIRVADVKDGMSNTVMVGERPPSKDLWYGWWYAGLGQNVDGSGDMVLGVRELRGPRAPYLAGCEPGPHEFGPGTNEQCDTLHFWSYHRGGGNFVRGDGSTLFLAYSGKEVLPLLATIDGGELVDPQGLE